MSAGTGTVRERERPAIPEPVDDHRHPVGVTALIAANLIEGMGGLVGGALLLSHPNGTNQWPVSWLARFPFHSFVVPGLILGTVLGAAPVLVAYGLWRRPTWRWTPPLVGWTGRHWSWLGAILVGVTVLAWMTIEVTMTPIRSAGMQVPVALIGTAMVLLPALPSVRGWARP